MLAGLIVVCLTGASRIDSMTPLINKNDRDICDRIYCAKAFIIVSCSHEMWILGLWIAGAASLMSS